MNDILNELRADTELEQLRSALQIAQRAARKKQVATDQLVAAVYQAAKDASLAYGPPRRITTPKSDKRKSKPEVALLHLTDWQMGKQTVSFDMATCEERIMRAVIKTMQLAEIQRADHPVRDCHVMLGGDMLEGVGIFPGQAFEVEAAAFEQVIATSKLIHAVVEYLLCYFEKVVVHEEIGNHGRLGRRGDHPHGDNLDRMAYTLARNSLGAQKGLTWNPFAGGLGTHVRIGNYTALLVHGDEFKSFGGNTPAFGILRKCNAWATGVVDPFNDVYIGHFHTPMALTLANAGRAFVTGSPESDNEYAKEFVAAVGKPSQRLHFIDPDKGRVTSEHLLWL